ncbi:MAG TPA: response regulator [Terriglobales bacterium]|nr:response regulator [Terriglobales bacterium]
MPEILLIDDSPVQLAIRQAVLARSGFSVTMETSAADALDGIRKGNLKPDLIITDHLMPGMNGVEFVRGLREFDSSMPVIVISGLQEASEEYDGLNVRFQMKPYPAEELIAMAQAMVESSTDGKEEKAS